MHLRILYFLPDRILPLHSCSSFCISSVRRRRRLSRSIHYSWSCCPVFYVLQLRPACQFWAKRALNWENRVIGAFASLHGRRDPRLRTLLKIYCIPTLANYWRCCVNLAKRPAGIYQSRCLPKSNFVGSPLLFQSGLLLLFLYAPPSRLIPLRQLRSC